MSIQHVQQATFFSLSCLRLAFHFLSRLGEDLFCVVLIGSRVIDLHVHILAGRIGGPMQ
jgi:hypothetical protein